MKKRFEIRTLGELLELNESGTWGEEGEASDYPVLRSSNIHDGKLVLNDVAFRKVSSRDAQRYNLDDGDIIVTKSSGSPHLIGKSCLFRNPDGRTYLFSNFTQRLRAKKEFIYPSFLHFFLQSPIAKDFLQKISNTTSGLRNLNMKDYGRQLIPVPPLPIQKQIAAILEKADAAREKRRQANKLTEQFLQSAFLEMFGDPVTNPKGWEEHIIRDLIAAPMKSGVAGRPSAEGNGMIHLRPYNVNLDFKITLDQIKRLNLGTSARDYHLAKEDVLFNNTNSPELVGKAAVFRESLECAFSNHMTRIRLKHERCSPDFIVMVFQYYWKQKYFQTHCTQWVNQAAFNIDALKNFRFPLPPISVQQKFADLVEKVAGMRAKQRESEKELESLFNALMQKAFRGELVS